MVKCKPCGKKKRKTKFIDSGLRTITHAGKGHIGLHIDHLIDQQPGMPLRSGIARNFITSPEIMDEKKTQPFPFSDQQEIMKLHVGENSKFASMCFEQVHGRKRKQKEGVFRDWKELWGSEKGKIAVVMGAGPSLADHAAFLNAHRDSGKLVLIGVNRTMRAVKPHYYINIERRAMPDWYITGKHVMTEKCDHLTDDICDFCDPLPIDISDVKTILTPQTDFRTTQTFAPCPENIYWAFQDIGGFGNHQEASKLTKFDVQASTTTAIAMYVAYRLGAKKIVMAGMDFAVEVREQEVPAAPNCPKCCEVVKKNSGNPKKGCGAKHKTFELGRLYFDQMFWETNYANRPSWNLQAAAVSVFEGIDGKPCASSWDFIAFEQFQRAVASIIHNDGEVEVVNASGQGLMLWNNRDTIEHATGLPAVEKGSHYQELYDAVWRNPNYHGFHMSDVVMPDILKFCRSKKVQTVLDVGCGPGRAVQQLLSEGYDARGFDCSGIAVSQAMQRIGDDAPIVRADLPEIPFDGRFDLALATEVMEHIDGKTVNKTLRNLRKQCKYAIITVPHNCAGFKGPHFEELHETVRDRKWWEAKLGTVGKVLSAKTVENSPVKSTMFTVRMAG